MTSEPPSDPGSPAPLPGRKPRTGDSLLDTIGRRAGRKPQVDLDGSDEPPGERPAEAATFEAKLRHEDRSKYRILGEIARGGMGVVLRGHDHELGRDVAMKVVHGELSDRPEVIERFVEEAQIGGQLQHPGIVPVYELGLTSDERPWFTMKLIKGRTLAEMLAERTSVDDDRVRFLSIFAAVCQTMAYAHSKRVIHRDLKPANVMVGSFGEVQVVDWGLSKVLQREGEDADDRAPQDAAQTVIATVRSGPESSSGSLVGNVLGTPAYMAPEQARGNVAQLDERADVFALGAILCEILTGKPPYVATDSAGLVQLAALAELDEANARIAASPASGELKRLCQSCLMPAREARPRNAEQLADAIAAHLARLESAAHEAQLAAAEGRLQAERSRRRLQLTSLFGLTLLLAAGGWWWVDAQRRTRRAELAQAFDDVQAEALISERAGAFEQALDVARGGLRLVEAGDADSSLLRRARELVLVTESAWEAEQVRVAELAVEHRLLDALTDLEMRQVQTGITETDEDLDAEYARAFQDYGLDLDAPTLSERLAALRDSELGIRIALGFDGWGRILRRMEGSGSADVDLVTGIGLDLDTDPFRTTVRFALVENDAAQISELAQSPELADTGPETLVLLGASLTELRRPAEGLAILRAGAERHPESFLLNFTAGRELYIAEQPRSIDHLRAAIALRPDLPQLYERLADAYRMVGDDVMCVRSLEALLELAPDHTWNARQLGFDYASVGQLDRALAWFERDLGSFAADTGLAGFRMSCEVMMGSLEREDYLSWAEAQRERAPGTVLGSAFLLCGPTPGDPTIDPARARALLDRELRSGLRGMPEFLFWGAMTRACLLSGDAPAALRAAERSESHINPINLKDGAETALLLAAAHRLDGNDARATVLLNRARKLRDQLIVGSEAGWAESKLLGTFAQFEPLAAGR